MDAARLSHALAGYLCPFCLLIAGQEHEQLWSTPDDIVWRDPQALVLIAAKQWPGTPGHALMCQLSTVNISMPYQTLWEPIFTRWPAAPRWR